MASFDQPPFTSSARLFRSFSASGEKQIPSINILKNMNMYHISHAAFDTRNSEKELLCHFITAKFPAITEGKVGLRHMYTRGARYGHFKVSELGGAK